MRFYFRSSNVFHEKFSRQSWESVKMKFFHGCDFDFAVFFSVFSWISLFTGMWFCGCHCFSWKVFMSNFVSNFFVETSQSDCDFAVFVSSFSWKVFMSNFVSNFLVGNILLANRLNAILRSPWRWISWKVFMSGFVSNFFVGTLCNQSACDFTFAVAMLFTKSFHVKAGSLF